MTKQTRGRGLMVLLLFALAGAGALPARVYAAPSTHPVLPGKVAVVPVRLELLAPEAGHAYSRLPEVTFRVAYETGHPGAVRFVLQTPGGNEYRTTLSWAAAGQPARETDPDAHVAAGSARRFSLNNLCSRPVDGTYTLTVSVIDASGNVVGSEAREFSYLRPHVDRGKVIVHRGGRIRHACDSIGV